MKLRERSDSDTPGPDPDSGGEIGRHLGPLRQRREDLLSAADEAIARGLSKESHQFNVHVRQASGQ